MTPHVISCQVAWRAPGTRAVALSRLTWHPARPLEVRLDFSTPGHLNVWTFARGILRDALRDPGREQGAADVRAVVQGRALLLTLDSPGGRRTLAATAADVERAVTESYAQVPDGAESAAVAVEIEALIGRLRPRLP